MIKAINPQGRPSAKQQLAMAPRLHTLDGKTIYVVDVRWAYTRQLCEEIVNVFSERYPDTQFVIRDKAGSYGESDPKLWEEIKEKGDGVIMSVGH